MSLFNELKRRNVLRIAAAYLVVAWLLIQVAETIFPLFGFDDTPARIVVIVLAIGFVPSLIIAWAFELTPEGLKKERDVDRSSPATLGAAKNLDRLIRLGLALALGYFAFDKFVLDPQRDVEIVESATKAGEDRAREEARLGMFNDLSVAVLPFANRSENKEDEFFTDGMHDELLTRLSRIGALKVISRTSVMRYRNTEKAIPEIARELSVATILEGGVQRSGNHVRINVQLIDAHTDEHLWAEIYDRELTAENLFAIQSEISTEIAQSLQVTLSPEEKSRIYDMPTHDLEAYNHFLRGRQLMASRNESDMQEALAEFEKATDLDPGFALAWVGVADVVHLLFEAGAYDYAEHLKVHREAAEKALGLNDQLGEAYVSMAFYYDDKGEHEKEEAAFLKAIELNPNYAQAYHWYANFISGPTRREKRLQLLYKAAQLDPLSPIIQINLAGALLDAGKAEESRQVVQEVLQRDPEVALAYDFLGMMDITDGKLAQAVKQYRQAMQLDPQNGRILQRLALVYLALGDYESVATIRGDMDSVLGPGNLHGQRLDYLTFIAQSNWQLGIDILERLPAQLQNHPSVLGGHFILNMYSGDFQKAYEYLLRWKPFLADRELWQQEITEKGQFNCEFADIMIKAGDEALGRDLLKLYINNTGNDPSSGQFSSDELIERAKCHQLNGSTDKALGILESEIAQGRAIDKWYDWGKSPVWKPLEDNPRFITLVDRIETKLAEQRELIHEIDDSGGLTQ